MGAEEGKLIIKFYSTKEHTYIFFPFIPTANNWLSDEFIHPLKIYTKLSLES